MPSVLNIIKAPFRSTATSVVKHYFHRLYYGDELNTWKSTTWAGIPILKCPLDTWIYQEILWKTQPDLVVETGTFNGGSALYMAHLFDIIGKGRILTVDIDGRPDRPVHPRITYLKGSSVDPAIVERVKAEARGCSKVMVILDSDHSDKHVTAELAAYKDLVSPGCYLIVEDTNINGHPTRLTFGPGPMEAVQRFMQNNNDFTVDLSCERLHLTFNPNGYLLRR